MTASAPTQQREQYDNRSHKLLEEIAKNTQTICVKLFNSSDADGENENGRFPKVERSAKEAHKRIDDANDRIDKIKLQIAKFAGGVAVLVFLMELWFKK